MTLDEIIENNRKREEEFNKFFGNAHKEREKKYDRDMAQANLETFGYNTSRTEEEMTKRKGYKYFYINDYKWDNKHHNKSLHKQPWNRYFQNAKLLTPSFNDAAKDNLDFYGYTNSGTLKKDLDVRKIANHKAKNEKNAYLKRIAKKTSTLNKGGVNKKWNNDFNNAKSVTPNLNDVVKYQNTEVAHSGDIGYWMRKAKKGAGMKI